MYILCFIFRLIKEEERNKDLMGPKQDTRMWKLAELHKRSRPGSHRVECKLR